MRLSQSDFGWLSQLLALGVLPAGILGADILKTSGFTSCLDDSAITVDRLNIQYDRSRGKVLFDVGGSSTKVQNVTASLIVSAYGKEVYSKDFNPCDEDSKVEQLCPGMSHLCGLIVLPRGLLGWHWFEQSLQVIFLLEANSLSRRAMQVRYLPLPSIFRISMVRQRWCSSLSMATSH